MRDWQRAARPAAQRAAAVVAMLTALAAAAAAGPTAARPNVVLFLIDDLGWADLGCYGSTFHQTPQLDRLAAGGLRFTQAYAACPVCSPTRASIVTGKYPARLHLTDWLPGRGDRPDQRLARPPLRQELPLAETTLAEALSAVGYATAHIGKWHLGGEGYGPLEQGYGLNVAGDHTGTPMSYFAPFRGTRGGEPARFMTGLEHAPPGEYLTDRLTAEAERFLTQHADRPFFLSLCHFAVHTPIKAPSEADVARFDPTDRPPGQQRNPIYAAMLWRVDQSVGRIMARLKELGVAERTIVIFTSDNGGLAVSEGPNTPATTNAPLREGKGYLYEGGIRVPLLVHWPAGIPQSRVCDAPVCSLDLFPTLVELCGGRAAGGVDGVSLAQLWREGTAPRRDVLYWHYPHYSNQGGRPGGAVRAGDWKLIEFYEDGRRELFHLGRDPREARNLSAAEPETVERLGRMLADWRREVGAQSMTPFAGYAPHPQAADGTITLPARGAQVFGTQLRYEPAPHKNTLGYWTEAGDGARWEFTLATPGRYTVEVLQGCGPDQGGSVVELAVGPARVEFAVEATGGFQDFRARRVGELTLDAPGRHTLEVRCRSKAARAVMDLRQVRLLPAGT